MVFADTKPTDARKLTKSLFYGARTSGKSVRQIEDELGITPGLLDKWKQGYQLHPATGEVQPREQHDLEAENRRLQRELALVRAERDLKKSREAVRGGCAMSYVLIQTERGGLPVERACRALKVSASGDYAWQKRDRQSDKPNPDRELVAQIRHVFEDSRGTYGRPRVTAALRQRGILYNRKRVAWLMRVHHLVARHRRRRRVKRTDSRHGLPPSPPTGSTAHSAPSDRMRNGAPTSATLIRLKVGCIWR